MCSEVSWHEVVQYLETGYVFQPPSSLHVSNNMIEISYFLVKFRQKSIYVV
jgi:hypothetical protein